MDQWLSRSALIIGYDNLSVLKKSRVAVLGLGGVGGAAAEAICRSGVGNILLMDHDRVEVTNMNRQLFATTQTLGQDKCEAGKRRLLDINPRCNIQIISEFYSEKTRDLLFNFSPDYIIDAIDTVTAKLDLAVQCKVKSIPLIMSMGTGNRLDPTKFRIGTIEQTAGSGCALARIIRRELKRRCIMDQTVVYSTEQPKKVVDNSVKGRHAPGSIAYCPPVAGYILASHVINQLIIE